MRTHKLSGEWEYAVTLNNENKKMYHYPHTVDFNKPTGKFILNGSMRNNHSGYTRILILSLLLILLCIQQDTKSLLALFKFYCNEFHYI